jgi:hypothetical protein
MASLSYMSLILPTPLRLTLHPVLFHNGAGGAFVDASVRGVSGGPSVRSMGSIVVGWDDDDDDNDSAAAALRWSARSLCFSYLVYSSLFGSHPTYMSILSNKTNSQPGFSLLFRLNSGHRLSLLSRKKRSRSEVDAAAALR